MIRILYEVASALSEAHGVGLIHRDIKPANIMLVDQGGLPDQAKVLDFGLVKQVESADSVALTRADAVTGTPQYLAPEAITDPSEIDARSDIYSLGAVGLRAGAGHAGFRREQRFPSRARSDCDAVQSVHVRLRCTKQLHGRLRGCARFR